MKQDKNIKPVFTETRQICRPECFVFSQIYEFKGLTFQRTNSKPTHYQYVYAPAKRI